MFYQPSSAMKKIILFIAILINTNYFSKYLDRPACPRANVGCC